ncbi:MAG: Gfo/Idh/MocA family protein [Thermomicrobiales bacterium]
MINVGVVGCGDVAFRTYFPGLKQCLDRAAVVALYDPRIEQAAKAAREFAGAAVTETYEDFLATPGLAAIFNLTPAPFHRDTTIAALERGLHVFSEKPLAATVPEAQELIGFAKEHERLLLCAPAVMATKRFKWIKNILADGRLGEPTLAVAQMANMGPAGWRGYTGDPAVFYAKNVGPMLDTGVYSLHAMTGLLGPARRVQAFGAVSIPERNVLIERLAGQTIQVGANDHNLIHLDFGNNRFAQLLSSFAVPNSKAPAFELHCTNGSISISMNDWYDGNGIIDIYQRDDTLLGLDGWIKGVKAPGEYIADHLIHAGPSHFIDCLLEREAPILTAEHACHVLEIILKATASTKEGKALELETTFGEA